MSRLVVGSKQNHVFCVVLRPKYARPFHSQVQDSTYRTLNDAAAVGKMLLARQGVIQAARFRIPQELIAFATPILPTLSLTKLPHRLHKSFHVASLETIRLTRHPPSFLLLAPVLFVQA